MRKSYLWLEQVFENRLVALVLATAVIVPLLATPADNSFRGLAAFSFEFLGLLLLAALLWRGRSNLSRENVTAFLRTGSNLPILLFLGIVTFSTVLSPRRDISAQELLRIGVGILLYFVVAYQFRRVHHLAKLVDTLLYLAIVSSLIGFTHYATSNEPAATGQFGDHQLFGSFLMLLLPILVVTAVTESRRNRQLAAQIATVLTGTCLLLTHARGAWLGGVTAIATMAVLGVLNPKQRTKWMTHKHEWIVPIMLVLAAGGIFLTLSPNASSIMKRASTLTSGKAATERAVTERQVRNQGTLEMIQKYPVFGVGLGLYPWEQYKYTNLPEWCNEASYLSQAKSLNDQAHNLYLQTAAELGLPGLLLLLGIIITFFATGIRQVRVMQRDFRRNLLIGALGATAGFAVDAIASPSWQFGNITMFLWLILGVGASCMLPSAQEEPVTAKAAPAKSTQAIAIPICLAMAIILPTSFLSAQAIYLPPPPAPPQAPNSTPPAIAGGIVAGFVATGILVGASRNRHGGDGGGSSANTHLLQPGDVIDIIVGAHKDLSKTVKIGADGTIEYETANSDATNAKVQAASLTTSELAANLQKSLLEFSKINQGDQVIVRLNADFQASRDKQNADAQKTVTQNTDNANGQIDAGQSSALDTTGQTGSDTQHTDTQAQHGE